MIKKKVKSEEHLEHDIPKTRRKKSMNLEKSEREEGEILEKTSLKKTTQKHHPGFREGNKRYRMLVYKKRRDKDKHGYMCDTERNIFKIKENTR